MLVARGLPCPVGLLRSGRRNTLVVKATFRLDGVAVWATTQAPLREAVSDEFGRRVFPSDFQAHKSACDVVIAGATLNALGPVRVRVGRHQVFADEPRALGPVPMADAGREASFARPNQQLPSPEFPLQLEVVLAGTRSLLRLNALPVHMALVVREDWRAATQVPLNLDAILVDPMREVAEFLFRGFFAHAGDVDAEVLAIAGPHALSRANLREATTWPRAVALEPRAGRVRETAFDLDEETFVADASAEEITSYPTRPELDDESTGIHTNVPSRVTDAFDAESTRPHRVLDASTATSELPFAPMTERRSQPGEESTQVNVEIPAVRKPELPFASESTRLNVLAPTPGSELPFGAESTKLHVSAPTAQESELLFRREAEEQSARMTRAQTNVPEGTVGEVTWHESFTRTPSRTKVGGEAGPALPFQGRVGRSSPRVASVPPDAGLPFRHPQASVPLAPPVPQFTALAPAIVAPLEVRAPAPALAVAPNFGPSAIVLDQLPTPVAVEPRPVVSAPAATPTRAPSFAVEGLTIEAYADIRSRLWRGEPSADVLRDHKLTAIRYRALEKKLQRYLDGLPPSELGKIIDLLG